MVLELVQDLLEAPLQEGVTGQAVGRHGAVEQPQLLVEDLHLGKSRVQLAASNGPSSGPITPGTG